MPSIVGNGTRLFALTAKPITLMHTGNDRNSNPAKKQRVASFLPALTAEEIYILKAKRYIAKYDVMRFLQISETTYHRYLAQGRLIPSLQFTKKLFDLDEIYRKLDEGKQP